MKGIFQHKTHGMSSDRFYKIYRGFNRRCYETEHIEYHRYGARGIKSLWNSFEEFRDDMYEGYKLHVNKFGVKNTTIDRLNSEGNYCKENCRWATKIQQGRNKSNNHLIVFKGETKCLSEWSEITKIKAPTIRHRLRKGWSAEKALTQPLMVNQFR